MISSQPVQLCTMVNQMGGPLNQHGFIARGKTKAEVVQQLKNKVNTFKKTRKIVRTTYPIIFLGTPLTLLLCFFGTGLQAFAWTGLGIFIAGFVLFVRFVWPWLTFCPINIENLEEEIERFMKVNN